MFDGLAPVRHSARKKGIRIRLHHASAFFVISIATGAVSFYSAAVVFTSTTPHSEAKQASVFVRLADSEKEVIVVSPLKLQLLAEAEMNVVSGPIQLKYVHALVQGVYDPSKLTGIYLYIDGVQAGLPTRPDEFGNISYEIIASVFSVGIHRIELKASSSHLAQGSMLQLQFDPFGSFQFQGGSASVLLRAPYVAQSVSVVDHGSVEAFSSPVAESSENSGTLYVYARGEDARIESLTVRANSDVTGARVFVRHGDVFVGSALFEGDRAFVRSDDITIRALRAKNLALIFDVHDAPPVEGGRPALTLAEIEVTGYSSGISWTEETNVQIL